MVLIKNVKKIIKNYTNAYKLQDETIELTPELTYFNNPVTHMGKTEYDLFFAYTKTFPLYDQRKIRDNRQYLPDIHENIFQQVTIR